MPFLSELTLLDQFQAIARTQFGRLEFLQGFPNDLKKKTLLYTVFQPSPSIYHFRLEEHSDSELGERDDDDDSSDPELPLSSSSATRQWSDWRLHSLGVM